MKFNYTMARPLGSLSGFERVVESEGVTDDNGRMSDIPDMFRLEFSGWTRRVEFEPACEFGGHLENGGKNE